MKRSDLPKFARQLCEEGLEAYDLIVPVPGKGSQVGLRVVGAGFFPLWELNDPTNARLVAARDFAGIRAKRPANWELVEPRLWDRLAPEEP
jgi:hypothetical protein